MKDEPQAQIRAHAAPAGRGDCAQPRVPSPAGGRRGEPTAPTTPRSRPTRPRAVAKKCRAGHSYSSEPPGPSAEVQGRARFGASSSGINAVFAHCTPKAPRPVSGRVRSARPIPSGVAGPRPHEVPLALLRPLRLEVPPTPAPDPASAMVPTLGAQSTLGPRVKVQRSHALGALSCPALPSRGVRQELSALKCWRASPPKIGTSLFLLPDRRAALRWLSRGLAASPRDPGPARKSAPPPLPLALGHSAQQAFLRLLLSGEPRPGYLDS